MEYTQENINRIKPLFPNNFIRDVVEELSTSKNRVPYSTVYDALTICRTGKRKDAKGVEHKVVRNQVGKKKPFDKLKCWNKALQMLREKGILND